LIPFLHLLITSIMGTAFAILGVIGLLRPGWLGLETMARAAPNAYGYNLLLVGWLLLWGAAGPLLAWLIPARCPSCGAWRSHVFRESVDGGRAIKYR
jgi:hypothetical protein